MPRICYIEKRFRGASLQRIEQANEIIAEYDIKLTLRQLYYQFVARDLIPNTEKSYNSLGALISDARLAGLIDWDSLYDRTRNLQSNAHWDSPHQIVEACSEQFRVDRWANQEYRPEVWIEKDALAGVIERVCKDLDVPWFSCRGYTSQSEMWNAGQRLRSYRRSDQRPVIFHLGEHDPSGIDMTRDIRDRLTLFVNAHVDVRRIALTMGQIEQYNPPPNPAKTTDSRFADYCDLYGDESWELDALEPNVMVELVRKHIESVRDDYLWNASGDEQSQAREQLSSVANDWEGVVTYLEQ